MDTLVTAIQALQQAALLQKIEERLQEFASFKSKGAEEWFSELCFCLLTANAKARTALQIQQHLGAHGFLSLSQEDLSKIILHKKHRFHNTKAKYIVLAREHQNIKYKLMKLKNEKVKIIPTSSGLSNMGTTASPSSHVMREWLVTNVKGLGYKEASHFLRNVGFSNVAILDRHILNILFQYKIIRTLPKSLTKKEYLAIEKKMEKLCTVTNLTQAELDLYLWYMKTGEVLK